MLCTKQFHRMVQVGIFKM